MASGVVGSWDHLDSILLEVEQVAEMFVLEVLE